ncbi:hypothetical protein EV360DRAFT_74001 [Lentinula raphanica]|nr:hypothetical protein EV360DRAFT_74001 [Lentinula raphanica]
MSAITDRLPVETIHEIITFLDSPSDVLSFGLSSKTLAEISIPHHYIYRVFRVKLSESTPISRFFAQADLAAGEVRELDILPENIADVCHGDYGPDRWMAEPLIPPKELALQSKNTIDHTSYDQVREVELLLIEAVKQMKRLKRFGWYQCPRPLVVGQGDLWYTLGNLGSLDELDVADELLSRFRPSHSGFPDIKLLARTETFLNLRGLKALTISTHAYDRVENNVDITGIIGMFVGNKDLEKLKLLLKSPVTMSITPLLAAARWDHMRILHLSGSIHCTPSPLLRFLYAHPLIEELTLAPLIVGKRWLHKPKTPPTRPLLPHLRRLNCKVYQVIWLVEHGAGSGIIELTGISLARTAIMIDIFSVNFPDEVDDDDEGDLQMDQSGEDRPSPFRGPFLDILRTARLPVLTKLGVRGRADDFADIVPLIPHVRKLALDFVLESNLDDFLPQLASLPNLTVLHAPALFYSDRYHLYKYPNYNFEENAPCVYKLARACPLLRRITFENSQYVVIRDGDELKWVYRKLGDDEPTVRVGETVRYAGVDMVEESREWMTQRIA